jgi:hypothetical protein
METYVLAWDGSGCSPKARAKAAIMQTKNTFFMPLLLSWAKIKGAWKN